MGYRRRKKKLQRGEVDSLVELLPDPPAVALVPVAANVPSEKEKDVSMKGL